MNKIARTLALCIVPLVTLLAAGCSPAHRSYLDCYVDCRYCLPPPLPHVHYDGCACHSDAASPYVSSEPDSVPSTSVPTYTDSMIER